MPFLLMLFLALACLEDDWRTWDWIGSPSISFLLMGLGIVAWTDVAASIAHWAQRQLRRDLRRREQVLRRYSSLRFYHTIGLLIVYSACLYGLGWGAAVQALEEDGKVLFPGGELLVLAPFLAGQILSWICFYDAERAIHDTSAAHDPATPFWTRWRYLSFHVRQNYALVLIPVLLFVVQKGLSRLIPHDHQSWHYASVIGLVAALGVFVGIPWILRLMLGLRPLPEGPLRQRLLAVAERLNFRCSNILLWNTHGSMANAMVAGVVPWIRYVLLTDRLVAELKPNEVEAVFGHEIGHVKHQHIPYYVGFLVVSMTVLWLAAALCLPSPGSDYAKQLGTFPVFGLLLTYILVVFGFLSRRCERQADIYGCRAVSCTRTDCTGHDETVGLARGGRGLCPTGIRTFIDALEKVASLNGINRDRPGFLQSWQHSTIARRVEFLQGMLTDARAEPRFQRRVTFVKWGLISVLSLVLVVLLAVI